jgi:hypothetical protein
MPAFASAARIAGAGPMPMRDGSTPTAAHDQPPERRRPAPAPTPPSRAASSPRRRRSPRRCRR